MKSTVSIVIPSYNSVGTVARAIESCLKQVYIPEAIVIVDNGSTDGSLKIAETYANDYPEMIKLVLESEKGAPYARNRGLDQVHAEWVQFLDADDELHPEKLNHQIKLIQGHTGFIAGAYEVRATAHSYALIPDEDIWLSLMKGHLGITSSNLWNAEAVRQAGGWNIELKSSQEAELMFRLLCQGWACTLDKRTFTIIHQTGDHERISTSNELENAKRFFQLRSKMLTYFLSLSDKSHSNRRKIYDSWYLSLDAIRKLDNSVYQEACRNLGFSRWCGLSWRNKLHALYNRFSR